MASRPTLRLLCLQNISILEQLRIEEALLRTDTGNWCLFNQGSSPAVVLGISGKPEKLLNAEKWSRQPLPLIRRFSGGGTVVVDSNTLFVTLIIQQADLPEVACYPEPILRWTETLYAPALPAGSFERLENDYAIAGRKFGGNAQYLTRGRWLHHSSLLWDYDPQLMDYLSIPERQPRYRGGRSHSDFLCRLNCYLTSPATLFTGVQQQLSQYFKLLETQSEEIQKYTQRTHRQATCLEELKSCRKGTKEDRINTV